MRPGAARGVEAASPSSTRLTGEASSPRSTLGHRRRPSRRGTHHSVDAESRIPAVQHLPVPVPLRHRDRLGLRGQPVPAGLLLEHTRPVWSGAVSAHDWQLSRCRASSRSRAAVAAPRRRARAVRRRSPLASNPGTVRDTPAGQVAASDRDTRRRCEHGCYVRRFDWSPTRLRAMSVHTSVSMRRCVMSPLIRGVLPVGHYVQPAIDALRDRRFRDACTSSGEAAPRSPICDVACGTWPMPNVPPRCGSSFTAVMPIPAARS